jgi:hypothetical protein
MALRFAFQCERTWESLERTHDQQVRQCDECGRTVHLSMGATEALRNASFGRCVAWAEEVAEEPRRVLVGMLIGPDDGVPVVGWVVDAAGATTRLEARTRIADDAEIVQSSVGFTLLVAGKPRQELVDGDVIALGGQRLVFKSTQ